MLRKNENTYVEVAYGTSKLDKFSNLDLYVANFNEMREAGLPQATIFMLDRTLILPWATEWFAA